MYVNYTFSSFCTIFITNLSTFQWPTVLHLKIKLQHREKFVYKSENKTQHEKPLKHWNSALTTAKITLKSTKQYNLSSFRDSTSLKCISSQLKTTVLLFCINWLMCLCLISECQIITFYSVILFLYVCVQSHYNPHNE